MRRMFMLLGMVVLSGCGDGRGTVPVEGILKLDGQPLKEASVQFVPQGAGRDATATTDGSGKFVMSTFEPRDGALPGSYKVVITPSTPIEATPDGVSADAAMQAASAAAVKPRARAAGPQVPESYTRIDQTPLKQEVPPTGEIVIDIKSK